ncbi:MAG: hypothetical protein ACYDA6_10275 [Solirubrobacteraceae bacterium]
MIEHTFATARTTGLTAREASTRAADLAERLLEEVSSARRSWPVVRDLADALSRLAAAQERG